MSGQEKVRDAFFIEVYEKDRPDVISVTFVPKGLQQPRGPNGESRIVPQYTVRVSENGDRAHFSWGGEQPTLPDATLQDFEREALDRLKTRKEWLSRLGQLMNCVEQWCKELDWSTRRLEKPMLDSQIGRYHAPVLLMQKEITRVMLEPVSRYVPGTEGLVDLYLMPAYDDIASLYHYDGRWHLHYSLPGAPAVSTIRDAESSPLSKESLQGVLEEMNAHAEIVVTSPPAQ